MWSSENKDKEKTYFRTQFMHHAGLVAGTGVKIMEKGIEEFSQEAGQLRLLMCQG